MKAIFRVAGIVAHAGSLVFGQPALRTGGPIIEDLIANARKHGDAKAFRRLSNLKYALDTLKASDLDGVQCGSGGSPIVRIEEVENVGGRLGGKLLKRYLPALAAGLQSATAVGLAVFLSPTPLAPMLLKS
jgi:hypothetical protein